MKTSKVRTGTIVGVLALPLIAVLAMVMFFSFSQSGPEQAQAATQGSATAMELRVPANAEVGSKFTVGVWANLTPAAAIGGFATEINIVGTGVKYNGTGDCLAEVKPRATTPGLALCDSFSPIISGGRAWSVLTDFINPRALDLPLSGKAQLLNVTYSCNTVGTHKIELNAPPANPDGSVYGLTTGAEAAVKTELQNGVAVADTASITCVPQAGAININVVDADFQVTKKLTDSCWLISVDTVSGPLSAPIVINKPFAVLADNNAKGQCNVPIKGGLSDSDPAVGSINVVISGKDLAEFGTVWHFQQIQTNLKYNLDPTKYTCTLSGLFKKTSNFNLTACDEADPYVIKNVLKEGTLNIQVNNNVTGGKLLEQVCFNIGAFVALIGQITIKQVCTSDGTHTQNLALDSYTVELKDTKLPASSLQLKAGSSATLNCDLASSPKSARTCDLTFGFEGQKVFHLKTPSLSNLFLTNQQGQAKVGLEVEVGTTIAPQTCRAGTDVALFTNSLSLEPASVSPKGDAQRVAAFEMEVRYDPKWVCVNVVPGDYWFLLGGQKNPFTGNVRDAAQAISDSSDPVAGGGVPINTGNVVCFIDDKNDGLQPIGLARIGCVSTGKINTVENPAGNWNLDVGGGVVLCNVDVAKAGAGQLNVSGKVAAGQGCSSPVITSIDLNVSGSYNNATGVFSGSFPCSGLNLFLCTAPSSVQFDAVFAKGGTVTGTATFNVAGPIPFTGVNKGIDQTLPMAYVLVKPQPEVYNQIIPNQENGIVTMILNAGCNLADDQGHPIDSSGCDDAALTIRWLEADFNGDCVVNVLDTQAVSLRWGAKAGSLLYDARMDTMPYGNIQGDQLINIKDVQFAYGRVGSECSEQNRLKLNGTPHPDQDPVPNK